MKKLLDKNNPENTIVHFILYGDDGREYECVGVLMKENPNIIRVAFNAKDDKVVDYLDIKKIDIISIDKIDPVNIEKL